MNRDVGFLEPGISEQCEGIGPFVGEFGRDFEQFFGGSILQSKQLQPFAFGDLGGLSSHRGRFGPKVGQNLHAAFWRLGETFIQPLFSNLTIDFGRKFDQIRHGSIFFLLFEFLDRRQSHVGIPGTVEPFCNLFGAILFDRQLRPKLHRNNVFFLDRIGQGWKELFDFVAHSRFEEQVSRDYFLILLFASDTGRALLDRFYVGREIKAFCFRFFHKSSQRRYVRYSF